MPLFHSRIQALCFDIDGTLRDTDDQFVAHLVRYLLPVGFLFSQRNPEPFARRVIMALEDPGSFIYSLPDRLSFDHHLARAADLISRLGIGKVAREFTLVEGIQEMLTDLYTHYPMAVVSARGRRSTMAFLDHFSLTHFFQVIVTAQTCRHTKPYPDPILWAAEQLNVSPEACLMIGDTTVDIRSGKAAGAQTLGVLCGFGKKTELRHAGADLILPSTSLLTSILLEKQP